MYCSKFQENPLVNPRTGRKIKKDGAVYLRLQEECRVNVLQRVVGAAPFMSTATRQEVVDLISKELQHTAKVENFTNKLISSLTSQKMPSVSTLRQMDFLLRTQQQDGTLLAYAAENRDEMLKLTKNLDGILPPPSKRSEAAGWFGYFVLENAKASWAKLKQWTKNAFQTLRTCTTNTSCLAIASIMVYTIWCGASYYLGGDSTVCQFAKDASVWLWQALSSVWEGSVNLVQAVFHSNKEFVLPWNRTTFEQMKIGMNSQTIAKSIGDCLDLAPSAVGLSGYAKFAMLAQCAVFGMSAFFNPSTDLLKTDMLAKERQVLQGALATMGVTAPVLFTYFTRKIGSNKLANLGEAGLVLQQAAKEASELKRNALKELDLLRQMGETKALQLLRERMKDPVQFEKALVQEALLQTAFSQDNTGGDLKTKGKKSYVATRNLRPRSRNPSGTPR